MEFLLLSLAASSLVAGKINVCRKRNYDRGVGKIRGKCLEGESRNAGLCYTNCKDGFNPLVTRCIMQCKDNFPVQCGLEYCAASKGDCAKIVGAIGGGIVGGAILGGLAAPPVLMGAGIIGFGAAAGATAGTNLRNGVCPWSE